MAEQNILKLRYLAGFGKVELKERIVNKDYSYERGCEMIALSNSSYLRIIIGINTKTGEINTLSYGSAIIHSANEFVITIPRKTVPINVQVPQNKTKFKLSIKQFEIRNFRSIPRMAKDILQRRDITDHFDSKKRYIYDFVQAGVLEHTITDNSNHPNQKYR